MSGRKTIRDREAVLAALRDNAAEVTGPALSLKETLRSPEYLEVIVPLKVRRVHNRRIYELLLKSGIECKWSTAEDYLSRIGGSIKKGDIRAADYMTGADTALPARTVAVKRPAPKVTAAPSVEAPKPEAAAPAVTETRPSEELARANFVDASVPAPVPSEPKEDPVPEPEPEAVKEPALATVTRPVAVSVGTPMTQPTTRQPEWKPPATTAPSKQYRYLDDNDL